ncbi:putative membrane protein [Motilibacter peucedani]|uniref:Putative membrane protein n=1 Tax=Motilibacter peucedani TaxID=598650 RepID=A0A420XNV6_9ACTN|nr:DUF2254 domain-containing protein [Motilibacter peucedani]RKS73868.1 putative membrane protein [Motilibacter peucedani]
MTPLTALTARLGGLREAVRTQLWPLPALGVLLAVGLGVALPRLDARLDDDLPSVVTAYLFGGGPGAARTVLDAIASSLITVTSLTFSLTVVTLQLASSQFSPRLLRTFMRDRFVHVTLALFLATFTFALTALRTVRSPEEGAVFVPQLSVTLAFLLTLASVVGLVLFLAHLATEIRVETMLRNVHSDASATLGRVLGSPTTGGSEDSQDQWVQPTGASLSVTARSSGFLVRVDEQAVLAAAVHAEVVVVLERTPGSWLVAGTPVADAWPCAGTSSGPARSSRPDDDEKLANRLADALSTGPERTSEQDIGYGLRQLADVTAKALSPGTNDPTTAVHTLGHTSALLCEMTAYDLRPHLLRDEQGRVRVVVRRPSFVDLLDLAVTQPRRYGAGDPFVVARLFALLQEVAWSAREPEQRTAVREQLARLRATTDGQDFDASEQGQLALLAEQVDYALGGRWETAGGL